MWEGSEVGAISARVDLSGDTATGFCNLIYFSLKDGTFQLAAISGPALGGMLIASGFGVAGVFLVTSIPQLCAGIAIFVMWRLHAGARAPATARSWGSRPRVIRPAGR